MVRKQVYLTDEQDRLLKQRAEALGVTEADVVRQALNRELGCGAAAVSGFIPNPEALRALLAFSDYRASLPVEGAPWKFNREELYEEVYETRMGRFDSPADH
jgi:hypothetical protein